MQAIAFGKRYSAELYYFLHNAALVFLTPFLAILWKDQGFSGCQIGFLSALRPFIGSISGQLLVGLADSQRWHLPITAATFVTAAAARATMATAQGFSAHLLLVVVAEACHAPFSIMIDTAVAASTDAAGYGRKRVLASLGWGGCALLSGWIVGRWGVPRSIAAYSWLVSLAAVPTLLLPLRELGQKPNPAAAQQPDSLTPPKTALLKAVPVCTSSHDVHRMNGKQYSSPDAGLMIELTDAAAAQPTKGRIAREATTAGLPMQALPEVTLSLLGTTADKDAAAEVEVWSIRAVGSPRAAQRSILPPTPCTHEPVPEPGFTPRHTRPSAWAVEEPGSALSPQPPRLLQCLSSPQPGSPMLPIPCGTGQEAEHAAAGRRSWGEEQEPLLLAPAPSGGDGRLKELLPENCLKLPPLDGSDNLPGQWWQPACGSSRSLPLQEAPGASVVAAELSVWEGLRQLLSDPRHAAFFATTGLMGIGFGCLGYVNLFLEEGGASGALLGAALLVATCGEVPVFLSTGWWLPRLGRERAFNVAFGGWVARLALYPLVPFLPSPWWVLPVELLHGLTFGMAYGVGTAHAKAIAPPHLRATTQSLFFSLYYGVGPGISGLAGGFVYQGMGMRWVFILGAASLAAGWAAVQAALRWATRRERTSALGSQLGMMPC